MRTRTKALTVSVAMVTALAILPTLGAAAAEPLDDGRYDVVIGEQTYTVEVVAGAPLVDASTGVSFEFSFDEDTGRVLDEFGVVVGDDVYDVEVEDGDVVVLEDDADGASDEGDAPGGEQGDDQPDEAAGDEPDDDDQDDDDQDDVEDQDDDAADETHGALVSTVARCAPSGRTARDAGLPNHGTFVSAAARGQTVDFEVDGEPQTADLTTPEGVEAFCSTVDELLDRTADDAPATPGIDEEPETTESDEDGGDGPEDRDEEGRGNGRGHGREHAPGQQKKNG